MKIVSYILSIFVVTSVFRMNSIEYSDAMEASENYILLDVRMYEKYQLERIPSALYAGERKHLDEITANLDKDTDVFIYCSYGDRSVEVVKILKRKRFKTIYDLEHGFEQWYMDKMPIDTLKIR
ncbi:rhodanese-like domain-containing protein [Alkalitalea saponilacus]|nr:rhodanese-like domain-containing protein [Alkalitalea saponilacus]ASB49047.1 hypothetical protein CDL62_07805 [Alkalitalea saponilacus]